METLKLFFEAAGESFMITGLEGDFLGLNFKKDGVYFVHNPPLQETLWEDAAGMWESIYRRLRNIGR